MNTFKILGAEENQPEDIKKGLREWASSFSSMISGIKSKINMIPEEDIPDFYDVIDQKMKALQEIKDQLNRLRR